MAAPRNHNVRREPKHYVATESCVENCQTVTTDTDGTFGVVIEFDVFIA